MNEKNIWELLWRGILIVCAGGVLTGVVLLVLGNILIGFLIVLGSIVFLSVNLSERNETIGSLSLLIIASLGEIGTVLFAKYNLTIEILGIWIGFCVTIYSISIIFKVLVWPAYKRMQSDDQWKLLTLIISITSLLVSILSLIKR